MNLIKDKNELAPEFPKLTVYRPKFYSMVSVKGFFKTNAKTLWTCKKKFFIDYMDAIGMAESIPDPRFK